MLISKCVFAVTDIETTGTDPLTDEILEIAIVPWGAGMEAAFTARYGTTKPIPASASAVHHIIDEDVAGLPVFDGMTIGPAYGAAAAHNASFEKTFLKSFGVPWVCTYRFARKLWPELDEFGLQFLRYWFKLPVPRKVVAHSAIGDAETCTYLLELELAELGTRPDLAGIKTIEQLCEWLAAPILLHRVQFGKHIGELWKDVPAGYLRWAQSNMKDMDADLSYTVNFYANPAPAIMDEKPLDFGAKLF